MGQAFVVQCPHALRPERTLRRSRRRFGEPPPAVQLAGRAAAAFALFVISRISDVADGLPMTASVHPSWPTRLGPVGQTRFPIREPCTRW